MIGQAMLLEQETRFAALDRCVAADHETLARLESAIAERALPACVDPAGKALHFRSGSRTVVALPLDTRRFVRAMARHVSMN